MQPSAWLDTYCDLVQSGLDGADAIAAPTMWMLRALQRNFRLKSEAIRVIANARAIPKTWQRERKLQAVTLGRLWDEGKGIQTLLDVSWSLPVVIAGEQSFEETFAPKCQNEGITWLGKLDEEEVTALLHSSSIYIAPSLYEPFGLAVLEAALCGCALLLRDLPSFREVWADAALYFSTDEQLEATAAELSRDGKLLTRMQRAARKHAEHYSVEKMTVSYLDLYSEAISACRNAELTHVA
jgi:glycosyltransferase involved in cell wall biosynthesis